MQHLQCADVDIGGRKQALRARVNWQCWRFGDGNFRSYFY